MPANENNKDSSREMQRCKRVENQTMSELEGNERCRTRPHGIGAEAPQCDMGGGEEVRGSR